MGFRKQEVDITLGSMDIAGLVEDWRVSNKFFGLDHRQIRFTLRYPRSEQNWGRSPRFTNWNEVMRLFQRSYSKECSPVFTQNRAWIQFINVTSFELNCPKRKLTWVWFQWFWWNNKFGSLRSEVRRLFTKAHNTITQRNVRSSELQKKHTEQRFSLPRRETEENSVKALRAQLRHQN